ncbi:sulfur carrier protein ThiS [Budvicia aquatica]|uniref:Sulfur carrier protein ThiS n=1 Tax=Budvicia aquatica TaxID=82979 RepID=A0A2C6DK51_9GAMM|nr:sulfur carrier protein ThiS [Budvicia aquatica]PHI28712.1 sulfur carrier protein ThiS [Budvicia aquatica]VFS46754.1 Thiamine biosynthesis protein ThiS [Budvicia aquatica]
MQIMVNDSPFEAETGLTIQQLIHLLNQSPLGMAVAVNQVIQPRAEWQSYLLQDGDNILLFQAIAGG